jgi:hypothetical protein
MALNLIPRILLQRLMPLFECLIIYVKAKVGEVPTVRSSDTDVDLPIVLADLFTNFKANNRFIAAKWLTQKRYNHFIASNWLVWKRQNRFIASKWLI